METELPKKIEDIQDIKIPTTVVGKQNTLTVLNTAIGVVAALVGQKLILRTIASLAITASLQTVTALLAAVNAQCDLDNPPEEIEMKLNDSGKLIYRCYHSPAHEWDLSGNRIP